MEDERITRLLESGGEEEEEETTSGGRLTVEELEEFELLLGQGGKSPQVILHDVPLSAIDPSWKLTIVSPGASDTFLSARKRVGRICFQIVGVTV